MAVAVAIVGLLTMGVTTTVFQVSTNITRCNNQMTAIKQVENALHWISRDSQMTQYIDSGSDMTNCQFVNGTLIFEVTAIAGKGSEVASETRICEINPGPDLLFIDQHSTIGRVEC